MDNFLSARMVIGDCKKAASDFLWQHPIGTVSAGV